MEVIGKERESSDSEVEEAVDNSSSTSTEEEDRGEVGKNFKMGYEKKKRSAYRDI